MENEIRIGIETLSQYGVGVTTTHINYRIFPDVSEEIKDRKAELTIERSAMHISRAVQFMIAAGGVSELLWGNKGSDIFLALGLLGASVFLGSLLTRLRRDINRLETEVKMLQMADVDVSNN